MNFSNLIRKPLIAAVLGASLIGVPLGTLYVAGAAHALGAQPPAAVTSPVSPAASGANPGSVLLPDFSSMVQKYGPAVVNIQVVTKVATGFNGQGDPSDEDNGDNGQGNPFFGPNSPFAPFFRGQPFQAPAPQPQPWWTCPDGRCPVPPPSPYEPEPLRPSHPESSQHRSPAL